jgi:hypothetical protein
LIFFISLASASFELGDKNYSIDKIYGPSAEVMGWVNMSFTNQPLDSEFEDERGNIANLSSILENNVGYSFTCNPLDCKEDYEASTPASTKAVTLNAGQSKTYGIRLTGNVPNRD